MTDGDIQQLDYATVLRLVFPKGPVYITQNNPSPQNWRPWEKPTDDVAIDNSVSSLNLRRKENEQKDRLRAPDQLAMAPLNIFCPFHFARHAIALAAETGRTELISRNKTRDSSDPNRWQRIHDEASDLADELRKFTRRASSSVTPHPYFLVDGPDITGLVELKRSEAIQALENLIAMAAQEKNRLAPPHSDGEVWKTAFVISLCYSWHALTGSDPKGTRFIDFLNDAYASLGGGDVQTWNSQIKRANTRNQTMPALQRFNWYEQWRR
jgi:hypothetical protein